MRPCVTGQRNAMKGADGHGRLELSPAASGREQERTSTGSPGSAEHQATVGKPRLGPEMLNLLRMRHSRDLSPPDGGLSSSRAA